MSTKKPSRNNYYRRLNEYVDQDYKGKLNDDERAWLDKFNAEYYGSTLSSAEEMSNDLHNTTELRRDVYAMNNANRRDVYNDASLGGRLSLLDDALVEAVMEECPLIERLKTERLKDVVTELIEDAVFEIDDGENARQVLLKFGADYTRLVMAEIAHRRHEKRVLKGEKRVTGRVK